MRPTNIILTGSPSEGDDKIDPGLDGALGGVYRANLADLEEDLPARSVGGLDEGRRVAPGTVSLTD